MGPASHPSRRHIDLAGIGLGIGDKFGNRLRRKRWIYRHDKGRADNARDCNNVAGEIEVQPLVTCRVDGVRGTGDEESISLWGCITDGFGRDTAATAGPILNNERLPEPL